MEIKCGSDARRLAVRDHPTMNGIDYLEVRTLELPDGSYPNPLLLIHCFKPASLLQGNILITGGVRVKNVGIEWAFGAQDPLIKYPDLVSKNERDMIDALESPDKVIVARATSKGDFSTYELGLVNSASEPNVPAKDFDTVLSNVEFSFKIECPSDFDCACKEVEQQEFEEPSLDYMAKDYSSFRRLVMDRLSLIMPDWKERNPADIGVMLVELLAYTGDHLSYYQDAAATESYLGTARRRVSAARHARLLDYYIDEGCNARAWVCFKTGTDGIKLEKGAVLFTGGGGQHADCLLDENWKCAEALESGQDKVARIEEEMAAGAEVFETMYEIKLYRDKHKMSFYTWGETDCWLPAGATSATLKNMDTSQEAFTWEDVGTDNDELFKFLQENFGLDWLDMAKVVNEDNKINIAYGNNELRIELDGDKATLYIDSNRVYEFDVEEVSSKHVVKSSSLAVGDVLVFEEVVSPSEASPPDPSRRHAVRLTSVSTDTDELTKTKVIKIAWDIEDALPFPLCLTKGGQETSVARGNTVLADHGYTIAEKLELAVAGGRYYPRLAKRPLTHAGPPLDRSSSAKSAFSYEPSQVKPAIWLERYNDSRRWEPQRDLLSSDEFAAEFVVETETEGTSYIRFGNADRKDWAEQLENPNDFRSFKATYRIGSGIKGNIGSCSISRILDETGRYGGINGITGMTNPMPASGGRDPESIESVRQHAPQAFRQQERAVTEQDYADVLKRHPQVQHAVAIKRWTGSWYTMFVTVDRLGGLEVDSKFEEKIAGFLEEYRLAGYDLEINPPRFVPLKISLDVCIKKGYFEGEVRELLTKAFSNRINADGSKGFFHPDNFTFAQPLYLSRIYEAAMQVEGVSSVEVKVFQRWAKISAGELDAGVISVGKTEIVRLDNDLSKAENGMIEFAFCGGTG